MAPVRGREDNEIRRRAHMVLTALLTTKVNTNVGRGRYKGRRHLYWKGFVILRTVDY